MKWIGALLFVSTTTWVGFLVSKRFNDRPKQIRQLKSALQILEAEMMYSQLPLVDAFYSIAKQIPEPFQTFFQTLANDLKEDGTSLVQLWNNHLHMLMGQSALGMVESDIMKQFGQTLGQHDFIQQQKQIQLARTHLDRELEEARVNQLKYSKMAKSLGFLGGLFIVLLLI